MAPRRASVASLSSRPCSQGRIRVLPDSRAGGSSPGWHDGVTRPPHIDETRQRGAHRTSSPRTAGDFSGRARRRAAQDLRDGTGDGARPGRHRRDLRARPLHRGHGPFGIGQVHAHALHGRPRPPDVGAVLRRRHRHRRPRRQGPDPDAAGPHRLRVPVLQPRADAHRRREHHPAGGPGRAQGGQGVVRLPGGPARHRRPAVAPAERAVGRAATALRLRPRPDQPTRPRLRRRAHREPGLQFHDRDAVLPAPVGRRVRPVHRHGHPRPPRGGLCRRMPTRAPRGTCTPRATRSRSGPSPRARSWPGARPAVVRCAWPARSPSPSG